MSSVLHAIRILNVFSEAEPELRLSDISRRVGLSKGHTHRLLSVLSDQGLVRRGHDSVKYRLGLRLFDLGRVATADVELRPAYVEMLELNRLTEETVMLAVRDDCEVVFLQKVDSPHALRVSPDLNRRFAIWTATGRALLAWERPAEIERAVRHSLASASPPRPGLVRAEQVLSDIRRLGYAVDDRDEADRRTVAAPIRDTRGRVTAALTVSGPKTRLARSRIPAVGRLILSAAEALSGSAAPASKLLLP